MSLAFESVRAPGSAPTSSMLFLHGILGRGTNWKSIARRWVATRPEREALLVDLRAHGASRVGAPPHTVDAAARDLDELGALPVAGVLGHSFGGKVALSYAHRAALDELWLIDSWPGPQPEGSKTIAQVLAALRAAPSEVASRNAFVEALEGEGLDAGVARWLAGSLTRLEEGFAYRVDLEAIEALLSDYYALDLRGVVANAARRVHLVLGTRSAVYDAAARTWAQALAESHEHVKVHELAAGHWVHVEAPGALLDAMRP